jgi:hypothetical protein
MAVRSEKEVAELKTVALSAQMNTMSENAKWELESKVVAKDKELEEMRKRLDTLVATVEKQDKEAALQRTSSRAAFESYKEDYDQLIASKNGELEEMRKNVESCRVLIKKQVRYNVFYPSLS